MWNLIKPWRSEKTVIPFNCIFNFESRGLPWGESPSPVVRLCRALPPPQPLAPAVKQKYFFCRRLLPLRRLFPSQVDGRDCCRPQVGPETGAAWRRRGSPRLLCGVAEARALPLIAGRSVFLPHWLQIWCIPHRAGTGMPWQQLAGKGGGC